MPGGSVAAPLGQCSEDFETSDPSECVSVEHDRQTGEVNVTLSCCVYNDKMFQKETMITANAYRCEILVCEEKVGKNVCKGKMKQNLSKVCLVGWL